MSRGIVRLLGRGVREGARGGRIVRRRGRRRLLGVGAGAGEAGEGGGAGRAEEGGGGDGGVLLWRLRLQRGVVVPPRSAQGARSYRKKAGRGRPRKQRIAVGAGRARRKKKARRARKKRKKKKTKMRMKMRTRKMTKRNPTTKKKVQNQNPPVAADVDGVVAAAGEAAEVVGAREGQLQEAEAEVQAEVVGAHPKNPRAASDPKA